MVGRRSRVKTDENRAITPDELGRNSPRSRKCLDLDPSGGSRPSPLAEHKTANGWSREDFTPLKGEKEKRAVELESLLGSPGPASSDIFARTPFSCQPYTPVSTPRSITRNLPRSVLVSASKRRSAPSRAFVLPDQFKIVTPARSTEKAEKPEVAAIQSTSFYKSSPGDAEAKPGAAEKEESYVELVRRRRESKKVVKDKMRRDRTVRRNIGGGARRKANVTGRRGIFHAIKKPKKKLKVNVKISQMPAMSIEIPGSKSASKSKSPKTPKTPTAAKVAKTTLTPKLGNFALSKETSVDIEVKGGQIIYRKSNTPLRRSPRKNMSPLKQSYFHGTKPRSRSSGKLFSPGADFLNPELGSPQKHIPSPVKFPVSTNDDEEEETNISDIIDRLGDVDDDVMDERMESDVQLDIAPGNIVTSQFLDTDPAVTAFKAVQDILGEMAENESSSSMSQCSEEEEDGTGDTDPDKLFPIFYKDTAQTGKVTEEPHKSSNWRGIVCQDPNQLQIDAGQDRGPTLCLTCGTVYAKGDPEDEASHERVHDGVVDRLRFPGWRRERNCGPVDEGRVIMVQPGDAKHMWKKVEEALTIVDRDLGFSEVGIRFPEQTKVFLYIAEKKIGGLLLAESIPSGYRVLQEKSETGGRVFMCSESPNPVVCGISRIWVLNQFRRKGVASRLVDSMRSFFLLGKYLKEDDFAFSDPTLNGMDFATKYMKRKDFLVYSR